MLVLICGRCRAGKTTYSRNYRNVIHLDNVSRHCLERYPKVLEIVTMLDDVTVDGIYDTAEKRIGLLSAYKGDMSVCLYMDTPLETIASRMNARNVRFIVPKIFEPPTYEEGWDEIWIVRDNEKHLMER